MSLLPDVELKGRASDAQAQSSTGLASIGQTRTPWFRSLPNQAYKISKTALNMLSAQWASTLDDEGFAVVALSPGVSVARSYARSPSTDC